MPASSSSCPAWKAPLCTPSWPRARKLSRPKSQLRPSRPPLVWWASNTHNPPNRRVSTEPCPGKPREEWRHHSLSRIITRVINTRIKQENHAQIKDPQGRGQALQEDRYGENSPRSNQEAPHPNLQDQEG